MSNKKAIVYVEPKTWGFVHREELEGFAGYTCPVCEGEGTLPVGADHLGVAPPDRDTCLACLGAGKLQAKVIIEWMPDEGKRNQL